MHLEAAATFKLGGRKPVEGSKYRDVVFPLTYRKLSSMDQSSAPHRMKGNGEHKYSRKKGAEILIL